MYCFRALVVVSRAKILLIYADLLWDEATHLPSCFGSDCGGLLLMFWLQQCLSSGRICIRCLVAELDFPRRLGP